LIVMVCPHHVVLFIVKLSGTLHAPAYLVLAS
jgi:hypothetical protein